MLTDFPIDNCRADFNGAGIQLFKGKESAFFSRTGKQMTVRPSTRTVICKNCKVARLVQKSPKPVGDLGERDQRTRRGFSSEGLGFGCGWENGCIRGPINGKVKG